MSHVNVIIITSTKKVQIRGHGANAYSF